LDEKGIPAPESIINIDLSNLQSDESKRDNYLKRNSLETAKFPEVFFHVKEIKFRPSTEENDYQVKLQNVIKFLTNGDKVKVTLRFRGREMAHQEYGSRMLSRIQTDLDEYGIVEQFPKLEGRQMVMVYAPKK